MGVWIEPVFTVLEALLKVWFITKFFGYKKFVKNHFLPFAVMTIVQVATVMTLNQFYVFEGLLGFAIYIAISFAYTAIFLKGSVPLKLFVCCAIEIFLFAVSMSTITLFSIISGTNIGMLVAEKDVVRILYLSITLFIKLFVAVIIIFAKYNKNILLKKFQLLFFTILFLLTIAVSFSCFELQMQIEPVDNNIVYLLIIVIGIILISCFVFYFAYFVNKENQKSVKYELQKLQLDEQQGRIEQIDNEYKNIAMLRHDFSNYLFCAIDMLDKHNYDEAQDYLNKLTQTKLSNKVNYVNLGNNPVTSVINIKLGVCATNNIGISYVINADIDCVDKINLSILLANVFDNAIEAEKHEDNPKIEIRMENHKNYLCVELKKQNFFCAGYKS